MFGFTIRELVLLTLVVAMGVGWWLDRQAIAKCYERRWDWILRANYDLQRQVWADGHTVEWYCRDKAGNVGRFMAIDGKRP